MWVYVNGSNACKLNLESKVAFECLGESNSIKNYITCNFADTFIQSDLQLVGLAQGPNSCTDLILATPGIEQPTSRVQVK